MIVNRYKEGLEVAGIQARLGEGIQACSYKFMLQYQFHFCEFQLYVYKRLYTCLATLTFLLQFTKTTIIRKSSFYNEGLQESKEDERKSAHWLKIRHH